MSFKKLITSGCSYSQVPNTDITWPVHLKDKLKIDTEFHAKGAAGNGIISRTIIYNVTKNLEKFKPEEILVGIMWSGLDRFEIYKDKKDIEYTKINSGTFYCNPQSIINSKNYILINNNWTDELSKIYYKNIYSDEWASIVNLEHILRTQWFLQNKNIKYFMTTYDDDGFPKQNLNEDVQFLLGLIDFSNWIDIKNMGDWSRKTGLPFRQQDDSHPSTEMHKLYVEQHIIPHLKNKKYI